MNYDILHDRHYSGIEKEGEIKVNNHKIQGMLPTNNKSPTYKHSEMSDSKAYNLEGGVRAQRS